MNLLSNSPTENNEYEQLIDNQWFKIKNLNDFKLQCCDCGLVHDVKFEIQGNELFMMVCQNKEETDKVRKENKINVT